MRDSGERMQTLAKQDFWDSLWDRHDLAYDDAWVLFRDLFDRYLKPGGTCLEIGCYPGNFLIYLGRKFGYTVSGVDLTPHILDRMPRHLERHGVRVGELHYGDFFEYEPEEPFDVVCSFGFVEHFPNFEEVIARHVRLLKPGGTLVITCPNFRRLQFVAHHLLDRENLRRHFLPSMDLARWGRVLRRNGVDVLHSGYYKTADFWVEAAERTPLENKAIKAVQRVAWKLDRTVRWPNPFTSPFMACVGRKRTGGAGAAEEHS